jgi:hypothetical protein
MVTKEQRLTVTLIWLKAQRILIFSARNPGTVRVSTGNSKAKVISSSCAIFSPATAVFRFTAEDNYQALIHVPWLTLTSP